MRYRLLYSVAALMAAIFLSVSCQDRISGDSGLIIDQEVIEFAEEGGAGKVTFTLLSVPGVSEPVLEGLPEWITDPVTSVDGEVSFTVSPNVSDSREAVITLSFGELYGTFTVRQDAFNRFLTAEQMKGRMIKTVYCQFFDEETIMYKYNVESNYPSTDQDGNYVSMTAGEWAEDFVEKYNRDHPDAPGTVEQVLRFDFTEIIDEMENYLFIKTTTDNMMECWYGTKSAYADVAILKIRGEYTYDETTGTMTIHDVGNTNYTRTVEIKFWRVDYDTVEYQITGIEFPYMVWIEEGDQFPFMFADYDEPAVINWMATGKIIYSCNLMANV